MSEEVTVAEDGVLTIADYDLAYRNKEEIKQRKEETAKSLIELGRLFKENKEGKLYELLDYGSFEEFLGDPEIAFQRSTVYSFIRIYELYVEKLGISTKLLISVGHSKLQAIIPVVESDPEEWLFKARELSRSDLTDEVRIAQGKETKQRSAVVKTNEDRETYDDYLRTMDCILCHRTPVDPAHFPRTERAGGRFTIPLCRECHGEIHNAGVDTWFSRYKINLDDYLYGLVSKMFKGEENG